MNKVLVIISIKNNYEFKDKWNRIASECIKHIRRISPTIKILVGGYYNNAACAVKDIDVPIDDNIVFNFHCYDPLIFTHQGAYWVQNMDVNYRQPYRMTFKDIIERTKSNIDKVGLDYSFMDENETIGPNFFEKLFEEAINENTKAIVPVDLGGIVCDYDRIFKAVENKKHLFNKNWHN